MGSIEAVLRVEVDLLLRGLRTRSQIYERWKHDPFAMQFIREQIEAKTPKNSASE